MTRQPAQVTCQACREANGNEERERERCLSLVLPTTLVKIKARPKLAFLSLLTRLFVVQ